MKITFVIDRLNMGGAERHSLNLAKALSKRGHEVSTIVLYGGGSNRFPISEFPTSPFFINTSNTYIFKSLNVLSETLRRLESDIVIAINQKALIILRLCQTFGVKIDNLVCRFSTTKIDTFSGQTKARLFKNFLLKVDHLIYVSYIQKGHWEAYNLRARNNSVIQNGVDTDHYYPATQLERDHARRLLGIGDGSLVLLLVGRLDQEKNHEWLILTVKKLISEDPERFKNLRILFVGEGNLKKKLEAIISDHNLDSVIQLCGSSSDVRMYLHACDIGLLLSRSVETFSNAALEMMASGIPMIMTDTGGAREIVSADSYGHIIRLDSYEDFKFSLSNLLSADVRNAVSKKCRERALANFDYEPMVTMYENLFLKMLNK